MPLAFNRRACPDANAPACRRQPRKECQRGQECTQEAPRGWGCKPLLLRYNPWQ